MTTTSTNPDAVISGNPNTAAPMMESVHDQGISIREAAIALQRTPDEVRTLCQEGELRHRHNDDGSVEVHIHSVTEFLRRTMLLTHHAEPVREDGYHEFLRAISRVERKIDTLTERMDTMSATDDRIEADVKAIATAASGIRELVQQLKDQNSSGSVSDQTLSDLDAAVAGLQGIVPADPPSTATTTGPVNSGATEGTSTDTSGAPAATDTGTPGVDGSTGTALTGSTDTSDTGVDPTSGGATVGTTDSDPGVPASVATDLEHGVDPTVDQAQTPVDTSAADNIGVDPTTATPQSP